jgi:hypothetical protein
MDRYHIALFIHILTLIVAAATSAITGLAASRRARARTVGDLLDWHNVLTSTAKLFPICLVSFVITGAYMLSLTQSRILSTGYAVAGLVGVAWLLVSGIYLGIKGKVLKAFLDQLATKGLDTPAPKLAPPAFVAALPAVNTGVALAVAFDMTVKPESISLALGILTIALAIAAAGALRRPAAVSENADAS